MYERQLLRELEALRPDVNEVDKKVVATNGVPMPTVIPKLDDDYMRPPPVPPADPIRAPVPRAPAPIPPLHGPQPGPSSPSIPTRPASVAPSNENGGPLQSPGAGPSTAPPGRRFTLPTHPVSEGPPLGGRFVDGTKSMFISPSPRAAAGGPTATPSHMPPAAPAHAAAASPLAGPAALIDPLSRPASVTSLGQPTSPFANSVPRASGPGDLDPLGGVRSNYMSASVRVQPTRPRLDAREAASKLANMF
jgi:hypothetical protein